MAASFRDRPSPGRDQPAGFCKAPRWAGTAPTRDRGTGKGGLWLDHAAALSLQSVKTLPDSEAVAWPGISVVLGPGLCLPED